MSLVVAVAVAAGAGLVALGLGARAWWRRRALRRAEPALASGSERAAPPARAGQAASAATARPTDLWLGLGDVVQIESESPWLCAGAILREAGTIRAGIWWPGPGQTGRVVLELPAPERRVYWLEQQEALLPPGSPSRIELGGVLLDRRRSFPAAIDRLGVAPDEVGAQGVLSLYTAASGEVALVLQTDRGSVVAAGRPFELGEIDRLGYADPATSAGEPLAVEEPMRAQQKR